MSSDDEFQRLGRCHYCDTDMILGPTYNLDRHVCDDCREHPIKNAPLCRYLVQEIFRVVGGFEEIETDVAVASREKTPPPHPVDGLTSEGREAILNEKSWTEDQAKNLQELFKNKKVMPPLEISHTTPTLSNLYDYYEEWIRIKYPHALRNHVDAMLKIKDFADPSNKKVDPLRFSFGNCLTQSGRKKIKEKWESKKGTEVLSLSCQPATENDAKKWKQQVKEFWGGELAVGESSDAGKGCFLFMGWSYFENMIGYKAFCGTGPHVTFEADKMLW